MNSETACVGVPVRNRERAIAFYSALLGIDLDGDESPAPLEFKEESGAASGLIHLRIECIDAALEIVWSNGGRVLEPERLDQEHVDRILVLDCEGNRLALSVA
jgi:predicted enzyme related to lactoylglutathione lyase